MDFYDITQSFETDEATLDYLCLVSLEVENTLLDLEEDLLANELSVLDSEGKLARTTDAFERIRYTKTKALSERRIELLKCKIGLQDAMLSRVRTRLLSFKESAICSQEHLICFARHIQK